MNNNLTLYELNESLQQIMDLDLEQEQLDLVMKSWLMSFEDKSEGIVKVDKMLKASEDMFDAEIKRLQAKQRAIKNRRAYFKEQLQYAMEQANIPKIKNDFGTIYITGRDGSNIVDKNKLPDEYKETIVEVKIDKRKINKDIKEKDIPGVEKTRSEWVVIR